MGYVHQHPHLVHPKDRLFSEGREAASPASKSAVPVIGPAKAVVMVPGEGDEPDSFFIKGLQPLHAAPHGPAVLQGQEGRHFPLFFVLFQILQAEGRGNLIRRLLHGVIKAGKKELYIGVVPFLLRKGAAKLRGKPSPLRLKAALLTVPGPLLSGAHPLHGLPRLFVREPDREKLRQAAAVS